jgi:hypothetical protein
MSAPSSPIACCELAGGLIGTFALVFTAVATDTRAVGVAAAIGEQPLRDVAANDAAG